MNIDRINVGNHGIGSHSPIEGPAEAGAAGKAAHSHGAGEDSVALSPHARKVEQLTNVVAGDRAARMEQIRAAIEDGSYQVPSRDVALKMIAANRK